MSTNPQASVPYWTHTSPLLDYPALASDKRTGVCIVGAGIAGLCTAYFLAKDGAQVIVVDDSEIAGGETHRTTGHLTNCLDDHYQELEKYHGAAGARLAAASHGAAIEAYARLVQEHNIDCEFQKVDAYLFNGRDTSPEILDKELKAAHDAGLKEVVFVDRVPFKHFDTGRALRFPHQAEFHPLKFIRGLLVELKKLGVEIYCGTHVDSITDGSPCRVVVAAEHVIEAKDVVVATNSPINNRVYMHTKQEAYRTYVIAGPIAKGSVKHSLSYDTEDPYHYVRVTALDGEHDLLIVGGEDHKVGQDEHPGPRYQALEAWTLERFPECSAFTYRWSGQIMEPIDGLAFIGKNPGDDHIYIVTGDSGNGLTHGMIAGLMLPALIRGQEHPWRTIYDPARKSISAAGEFITANVNVASQYADWLTAGEVDKVEDISPGRGAIVRKGVNKYAVYRTEEGELIVLSAVCPHLGCLVRWNQCEKTWDCPCHGSRFSTCGEVLNGPAIKPMKDKPYIELP